MAMMHEMANKWHLRFHAALGGIEMSGVSGVVEHFYSCTRKK